MLKLKHHKGHGITTDYLICLGFSALIIILLSLLGAAIALSLDDPTGRLGMVSLCVMLLSAAGAGVFTSRLRPSGGIGFAALVSLGILLIMLLSGVIIGSGKVSGSSFMNYGCYFGVYLLASFIGKKREGHRRHGHH